MASTNRIIAFLIDLITCLIISLGLFILLSIIVTNLAGPNIVDTHDTVTIEMLKQQGEKSFLTFKIIISLPVIFTSVHLTYHILQNHIQGRTIGKALMKLRVIHTNSNRLHLSTIISREFVKFISLLFLIPAFIIFYRLMTNRTSWMDHIFNVNIDDINNLTETQKNFRKYHGNY